MVALLKNPKSAVGEYFGSIKMTQKSMQAPKSSKLFIWKGGAKNQGWDKYFIRCLNCRLTQSGIGGPNPRSAWNWGPVFT